MLVSGYKS